jgi:hypothetical protein
VTPKAQNAKNFDFPGKSLEKTEKFGGIRAILAGRRLTKDA